LRFRTLVLRRIILGISYKIGIVRAVSSCAGKIVFVLELDCHEHSDTVTAVPPVAVLFRIDVPAVTFVHSCNS
jgi:hypothetical protein